MKAAYLPPPAPRRPLSVIVLTALLGLESAVALGACVFVSMLAPTAGGGTTIALQFAAGGLLLFAIAAYVAARKAYRRRRWVHTFTAVLQLLVVVSIFVATLAGGWQPAFVIGLVLAGALLAVLAIPSLMEALSS